MNIEENVVADNWEDGDDAIKAIEQRFVEVKLMNKQKEEKEKLIEQLKTAEENGETVLTKIETEVGCGIPGDAPKRILIKRPKIAAVKKKEQVDEKSKPDGPVTVEKADRGRKSSKGNQSLSIEERQAAYNEARNRILGAEYKPDEKDDKIEINVVERSKSPETIVLPRPPPPQPQSFNKKQSTSNPPFIPQPMMYMPNNYPYSGPPFPPLLPPPGFPTNEESNNYYRINENGNEEAVAYQNNIKMNDNASMPNNNMSYCFAPPFMNSQTPPPPLPQSSIMSQIPSTAGNNHNQNPYPMNFQPIPPNFSVPPPPSTSAPPQQNNTIPFGCPPLPLNHFMGNKSGSRLSHPPPQLPPQNHMQNPPFINPIMSGPPPQQLYQPRKQQKTGKQNHARSNQ